MILIWFEKNAENHPDRYFLRKVIPTGIKKGEMCVNLNWDYVKPGRVISTIVQGWFMSSIEVHGHENNNTCMENLEAR